MMSHQKKGIHPRPCGIINLSNIISYGRGTLPYLIDELLNKTDKYGADVIAQAYVNVAKEIGKEDVWQMTKIDEAFNFEHPVFEREFDFIRSRDPEADAALDFLDMEMGRER